jgi:hypothetical protein
MALEAETPDETDPNDEWDLQIICQGIPRCHLSGADAIRSQENGCVWCEWIYFDPEGRAYTVKPGEA